MHKMLHDLVLFNLPFQFEIEDENRFLKHSEVINKRITKYLHI